MYYTIEVWYWTQYFEIWWDLEYREKERERDASPGTGHSESGQHTLQDL